MSHHQRGGVFSSNIFAGNRKGFYGLGQYTDPWTQQKALEAKRAIARAKGLGQATEPSPEPPPPKKMPVGLMVGWSAVLLASAGIFYAVTSGAPTREVRANRRRRRSSRRRSSRRRSTRAVRSNLKKYKALSKSARKRMPDSSFVFPDRGKHGEWPIKGPPGSGRERDKWQAMQAIRYLHMGRVANRSDYLKIRNAIINEYGQGFWRKYDGPSWSKVEKAKKKRSRSRKTSKKKMAANRRRRTSRR